jgi:monoamine oxidase
MQNVLIIGAGAAGLAAARDLATAGVRVTILEARERIGGRVYTYHDSSAAVPIELGAEFVHGKHPALMKILEESMTPFCDVSERHLYFDKGKLINSHEFWNELTALMDLLSLDKPDQTFKEFLASLPDNQVSHQASEVATLFVQGFHASSIDRIGTHGLAKANEAEEEIGGEKGFSVLGGYDRVVQALYDEAVAKGAEVKLRTVVKEIHWAADSVEMVCLDDAGSQQRFHAARVLITLPLGVLQADPDQPGAVRFVPQLPEEKRSAIQTLVMGHALRITILFRERFWNAWRSGSPCLAKSGHSLGSYIIQKRRCLRGGRSFTYARRFSSGGPVVLTRNVCRS